MKQLNIIRTGLICFILLFLLSPVIARADQAASIYDDERVRQYAKLYQESKGEKLVKTAVKDLKGKSPHPLSSLAWHEVAQYLTDDDFHVYWDKLDAKTKEAVGAYGDIKALMSRGEKHVALERYQPDSPALKPHAASYQQLANIALEFGNRDLQVTYLLTGLREHPSYFQLAWNIAWMNMSQVNLLQVTDFLAATPSLKGSPLEYLIKSRVKYYPYSGGSYRTLRPIVDHWLAAYPDDARALTLKGRILEGLKLNDEAYQAFKKSYELSPYYSNRVDLAEVALISGHEAELRNILRPRANLFSKDAKSAAGWLEAFIAEGWKSARYEKNAAEGYEAALANIDDKAFVYMKQASLALAQGQKAKRIIHIENALKEPGGDEIRNQMIYIRALLADGRVDDARVQLDAYKTRVAKFDNTTTLLASSIYGKISTEQQQNILQDAMVEMPNSPELLSSYGGTLKGTSLRAIEERRDILAKAFYLRPTSGRAAEYYDAEAEYLTRKNSRTSKAQLEEFMQNLAEAFPEIGKIHDLHLTLLGYEGERKASYWHELALEYPQHPYLFDRWIALAKKKQDWATTYAQLSEFSFVTGEDPENIDAAYRNNITYARTVVAELNTRPVAQEKLTTLLDGLQKTKLYLPQSSYQYFLQKIYDALGRENEAADALIAQGKVDPFNTSIFHDMVADYAKTRDLGWQFGFNIIDQRPYFQNGLDNFLHKHTMWGGSPIVALWAIERGQNNGLTIKENYRARAIGALGDPVTDYVSHYGGKNASVGSSALYMSWYDSKVDKVIGGSRSHFVYNFTDTTAAVEIHKANGEVFTREDSLIFGKPIRMSKQAISYEIKYTDRGSFKGVADRDGDIISLDYNAKNEIIRFASRGKPTLDFEYNEIGKPILIKAGETGEVHVEYDEQGNILKVSSPQGHQASLVITQRFQSLLSISKKIGQATQRLDIPDIGLGNKDQKHDDLYSAYTEISYEIEYDKLLKSKAYTKAAASLMEHLRANINFDANYLGEALDVAQNIVSVGFAPEQKSEKILKVSAQYLLHWKELKLLQKPDGLPTSDYLWWVDQYDRLAKIAAVSNDAAFGKILSKLTDGGMSLLEHERWLPKHDLVNAAHWQHHALGLLLSEKLSDAQINDSVTLQNGMTLVATSKGLIIGAKGHWRWMGYDRALGKWSQSADKFRLSLKSNLSSIVVDGEGNIWLGSAGGIMVLDRELTKTVARFETKDHGLNSPAVTDLTNISGTIYVSTLRGLSTGTLDKGLALMPAFKGKRVEKVLSADENGGLIVQAKGILHYLSAAGKITTITESPVADVAWADVGQTLAFLSKDNLYMTNFTAGEGFDEPRLASGQEDIRKSKVVHGLKRVYLPGEGSLLAILTDMGVAFYTGKHIEFMELPLKEKRNRLTLGPVQVSGNMNGLVFFTSEGIYSYGQSNVRSYAGLKATDLLTSKKYKMTFVADGRRLYGFTHGEDDLSTIARVSAKYLANTQSGDLIVATNNAVVNVDPLTGDVSDLFDLRQPEIDDENWSPWRDVTSLLVDSRGDIWAAKGATLFHYSPEKSVVSWYNFAEDPALFPSRANSLVNIHERPDGMVYVVASNNAHMSYKGMSLEGGLLRFRGDKFERVDTKRFTWFALGYTQLSAGEYMIGTGKSIVIRKAGDGEHIQRHAEGVKQLKADVAGVFYVRDGVKYDEDTYLVPTAGGIMIYSKGEWFPADHMNSLLPGESEFGQYGARQAMAVETDANGTIYVASKMGLSVFEMSGGAQALLAQNGFGGQAFARSDVRTLSDLNDQFLNKVDNATPAGRLLAQIKSAEIDVVELETISESGATLVSLQDVSISASDALKLQQDRDRLTKELTRKRKRAKSLVARLENEHRGLFQMLKLDPNETASIYKEMPDNALIIQYLPTPETLYIQLTDKKNGPQVVAVPVALERLTSSAVRANAALKKRAENMPSLRSITVTKQEAQKKPAATEAPDAKSLFVGDLAWLYDQLLRPIEGRLDNYDNIYLVPVGALTYVPFSALVRGVDPKIEYAVERYKFSTINSLFHLNLVLHSGDSGDDRALLVGNADKTLEYAQKEVEEIADFFDDPTLLVGDSADYDTVVDMMTQHGIVHLATHGFLDSQEPSNSYLKLAGNKRLNVIDISMLNMEDARVAVLSACETGLGTSGLEYATLARAFVHAKVPSIIASLWSVNDEPTKELMVNFYRHMQDGETVSSSLTAAQREMIEADGPMAWPEAWSGMVLFGKH